MRREDIKHIIEAVMFAYAEPISIKELNDIINEELASKEIEYMLNNLINEYKENNRGIQIIKLQDKYQMCTNKDYSSFIKKVLEPKKKKSLTQTTLETLTIIAYKQPITKVEIEDIRGVKSDKAIQTLLENNLIKEAGRLEKIGKPIIYKTTDEFLKLLNIEKLEDLPPIENYENDNDEQTEEVSQEKLITYSAYPDRVERLIIREKEYVKFDFTDTDEMKKVKLCDITLSVIDGMGQEYDNEFNMKDNYEYVIDKATGHKCKIENNLIKDVKVVKGNVQIELKLKENYNKALKFMYYVEV